MLVEYIMEMYHEIHFLLSADGRDAVKQVEDTLKAQTVEGETRSVWWTPKNFRGVINVETDGKRYNCWLFAPATPEALTLAATPEEAANMLGPVIGHPDKEDGQQLTYPTAYGALRAAIINMRHRDPEGWRGRFDNGAWA